MEVRVRGGETRDVRPVAIKLIHPRRAAVEVYLARFERETDTVVRLQHPNIVPVIDFGEWEGRPYIAFAWIAGEDLGARIMRAGRLTLDETLRVLAPVADALDAAHHTGLVHRDIKPGNILLGGRDEVYLTDFGLARPSDALAAPTLPGAKLMGTAPFIAPEQLRPTTIKPELASRIDIYALACVAFACLTGDGPFRRDNDEAVIFAHADEEPPNITEARPDLPAGLDPVLARALAKDPAARHATAREFVAALRTASTAGPVVVVPPPDDERTRPNAIVRVDPGTDGVDVFPLPPERSGANLNTAAFDGDGVLWFTGQSGVYGRLDPPDGVVEVFDAPRGRGPYGIAATPAGDVWYASLAGSHIARIDRATGEATVVQPPTSGQGARRVWSDSTGRLWVAEWNAGQVGCTTPQPASGASGRCPATIPKRTPSTSTTGTPCG